MYFDTHAGRGKYSSGDLGSPLVALNTVLEHASRDKILQKSEIRFCFIERDSKNYDALQKELEVIKRPKKVAVHSQVGECFQVLEKMIQFLEKKEQELAPAFVFVDPYGFKVPIEILQKLMEAGRVELFINFMWREVDMSISHAKKALENGKENGHVRNLDLIFGGRDWFERINSGNFDERAEQAVDLIKDVVRAKWATHIRMRGKNGATRYLLLHLTNHDEGRELMKDCIWKVCPDGGFYARKSDNPKQFYLISPEPDFAPLREWIQSRLQTEAMHWSKLCELNRHEYWRQTQPIEKEWVLNIQKQCVSAGVPFFFKQWGGTNKKKTGRQLEGRTWDQMPVHLASMA